MPAAALGYLVRQALWLAWACLILAGLPGCATWHAEQADALLAHPPADLPAQVALTATPFFAQEALQCGPAALATVLGAAGQQVTPEALASEVFVPERGGSLQIEMLAAARRHGVVSTRLQPDLAELVREVAAGHPVLVLLNLGLAIYPVWHYAVVMGYDLPAHEVLMRSGTKQQVAMPFFTFEKTWARSQRWAFVALPAGVLPATADQAAVTEASVAFERVAPPGQALVAYSAALERWPDSLVLGLGLGNALLASGGTAAAAEVFDQLARQHDSAVAWNNLAMARLSLHDRPGAEKAAREAVRRAEAAEPAWLDAARATLAQVLSSGPPP